MSEDDQHAGDGRTPADPFVPGGALSTGVPGLDALTGGGLLRGEGTLLAHDGRADLHPLLGSLLATALREGYAVEVVPTLHLGPRRLERSLAAHGIELAGALENDRLFVVDMIGVWEAGRKNVYEGREETEEVKRLLAGINEEASGPHCRVVAADPMAHVLGPGGARRLRYFQEALLDEGDVLCHLQNPSVVADDVAASYDDAARQVLAVEQDETGHVAVTLEASPRGRPGERVRVAHADDPPYLRVSGDGR